MLKRNIILLLFIVFLFNACFFRKNNQYAKDYTMMNKKEFAKKYYTLYNENDIDFSRIKRDKAYYVLRNGLTFQYIIFSEDRYIYETPLMPLSILEKPFVPIRLGRSSYFTISDNILKTESIAATPGDVYPIIEEGEIKNDTIFMKMKYNAKGFKNKRYLFDKFILTPKVQVYKISGDYFVEKKN